jgi:hypothetical protein
LGTGAQAHANRAEDQKNANKKPVRPGRLCVEWHLVYRFSTVSGGRWPSGRDAHDDIDPVNAGQTFSCVCLDLSKKNATRAAAQSQRWLNPLQQRPM